MEETKALHKLGEAVDLLGMIEELMGPSSLERISPAAFAGVRITIRNIRDMVQNSHVSLSNELVSRSRTNGALFSSSEQAKITRQGDSPQNPASAPAQADSQARSPMSMTRRDLKASLEKFVER